MGRYILRRLLAVPLLFLGVTTITFALVHLIPGSPADQLRLNVPGMTAADAARIKQSLGLDQPIYDQYLGWLEHLGRGDLGISLVNYRPVRTTILEQLPNTLLLTSVSLAVTLIVAVPLGVLSAVKRNSALDQAVNAASTLGYALPSFWIGLLLILFFAVQASSWGLPALPTGGMRSFPNGGGALDRLTHLILPVITLSVVEIAGWLRYVRAQMLEVLGEDYIRTARSKGLTEQAVILRHGFRTALIPLVTLLGLSLPSLFGGAAIIEGLFSWPGVGALAVQAAGDHDYPLIMGLVVVVAIVTLLANLIADIAYVLVDPRIKLG